MQYAESYKNDFHRENSYKRGLASLDEDIDAGAVDPLMQPAPAKDPETELVTWLKKKEQKYLLKKELPVDLFRVAIANELPRLVPGVNLWNEQALIDKLGDLKESGELALYITRVWEEKFLRRFDPLTYKERKRRAGRKGGLATQAKRRAARDRLAKRIVKMRDNGKSYKEIQRELDVKRDVVWRAIRDEKVRTEQR